MRMRVLLPPPHPPPQAGEGVRVPCKERAPALPSSLTNPFCFPPSLPQRQPFGNPVLATASGIPRLQPCARRRCVSSPAGSVCGMTQQFGIGRQVLMRWLRAIAQGSTVLGIAMIGLVWASIAFHLASERQSAEQAAVENASNLARAFEAHLSQSLNDIDRTLDMLRAYYLRDPAKFDFRAGTNNTRMF